MPLDPSIIMGYQAPQIQNPMDAMGKAMQFKALANQSQLQGMQLQQAQQKWNDDQASRSAWNNNTTVSPDGSYKVNQGGLMSDLASSGAASQIPTMQEKLSAMNTSQLGALHAKAAYGAQLLGGVLAVPPEQQEGVFQSAKQQAQQMGTDTSKWPPNVDPNWIKSAMAQTLDVKDQIANHIAQQKNDIEQEGVDNKKQQLAFDSQKFGTEQHTAAFTGAMGAINSTRQTPPDVQQAKTDRYNAQKVLDLVNDSKGNLNVNMVPVVAGEVAKIAQGGAPQHTELENITPQDAQMMLAKTKQYLSSNPQSSQQDAFVKVYKDYANTIQGNATKVIANHVNGVISAYTPHLTPTDRQNIINSFANSGTYGDNSSSGSNQSAPMTGNSQSAGPTNASYTKSSQPPAQDYAIGSTGKSKSGVSVVYKGNGVWAKQ